MCKFIHLCSVVYIIRIIHRALMGDLVHLFFFTLQLPELCSMFSFQIWNICNSTSQTAWIFIVIYFCPPAVSLFCQDAASVSWPPPIIPPGTSSALTQLHPVHIQRRNGAYFTHISATLILLFVLLLARANRNAVSKQIPFRSPCGICDQRDELRS